MFDADFYDKMQSLAGAMGYAIRYGDAENPPPTLPDLWRLRAGYAEGPGWFMVQAREFDPEPITVSNLRTRDIYASESIVKALLEVMASEGWLDRRTDAYFLTPKGRALNENLRSWMLGRFAALYDVDRRRMDRLVDLLGNVIQASLQSPNPPGTWCLRHSRHRAPTAESSVPARLYQYLADFNAFRDDSHMAAWRPVGIDGRTLEAFSHVGKEVASSVEELFDDLFHRGYSRDDYAGALNHLVQLDWLEQTGGQYRATDEGTKVLLEIEQRTNDYFYGPWAVLSADEIAETEVSIKQLADVLRAKDASS